MCVLLSLLAAMGFQQVTKADGSPNGAASPVARSGGRPGGAQSATGHALPPGGLVCLSAFILARMLAARVRAVDSGPQRYRRAFASLSFRDVWNETRRSL